MSDKQHLLKRTQSDVGDYLALKEFDITKTTLLYTTSFVDTGIPFYHYTRLSVKQQRDLLAFIYAYFDKMTGTYQPPVYMELQDVIKNLEHIFDMLSEINYGPILLSAQKEYIGWIIEWFISNLPE